MNEPGKGNNGRDPWQGGGHENDLDKLVADLQRKLRGLFNGRKSGGNGGNGGKDGGSGLLAYAWIPMLLLAGWLLTGFYQVDAGERAVVLHFGEFETVTTPGLHWHLPWPIESRVVVNVDHVRSRKHQTEMLTKDENLVAIDMVVQYRVANGAEAVRNYVFNVRNPEATLADVADSALREVIGKHTLDEILDGDLRQDITNQTGDLIQQTLASYGTGLNVLRINFLKVLLPQPVRSAAEDVTRAREDRERLINEAQAYANNILPRARGEAARRIEEATAYQQRLIAHAQGEASRFTQLLAEYEDAPDVTRQRLYIETMEEILGGLPKVLIDVEGGDNMLYLPLGKYLSRPQSESTQIGALSGAASQNGTTGGDRLRDTRTRELR